MPEFLVAKVPYVPLKGQWEREGAQLRRKPLNQMPRYDHPAYQAAFRELNELLAQELNGHPQTEYMDTMMYGFWGEGHSWPYQGHPFASSAIAERTWIRMLTTQLQLWTKTPRVTNTQPDFSRVGNAELLDRAACRLGYRVRPSWIWSYEKDGQPGLVVGLVNDGIAGVPGALRLTVFSADGKVHSSGCLDAGYPMPRGVRQAMPMAH